MHLAVLTWPIHAVLPLHLCGSLDRPDESTLPTAAVTDSQGLLPRQDHEPPGGQSCVLPYSTTPALRTMLGTQLGAQKRWLNHSSTIIKINGLSPWNKENVDVIGDIYLTFEKHRWKEKKHVVFVVTKYKSRSEVKTFVYSKMTISYNISKLQSKCFH